MLASNKLSVLGSSLKRIWSYFQLSADSFELSTDLFYTISMPLSAHEREGEEKGVTHERYALW
jgi:hypothetical protein